MEGLVIQEEPQLQSPSLVAGLGGWANAAEVSTGVVDYLIRKLSARKFAQISGDFYVFYLSRPTTIIEGGMVKEVKFPANNFFFWKNPDFPSDLVLFRGEEPHWKWSEYIAAFLQAAARWQVKRIYTIGGVFGQIPHTGETAVSGLVSHPSLQEAITRFGVGLPEYQGPTSIHAPLLVAAADKGIECVSLWGQAPFYISVHNPKVCYGVLRKLTRMMSIEVDLEDMRRAGEELSKQVDKAVARDRRLREYIQMLEEGPSLFPHLSPETAEDMKSIVQEVEEFLKRMQRGEEEEG